MATSKFQHNYALNNSACAYFDFLIIQYSMETVNLTIDDCQLKVLDSLIGQFVILNGNFQVLLTSSNFGYFGYADSNQSAANYSSKMSSFGLLKADRFIGTFNNLSVEMMDLSNNWMPSNAMLHIEVLQNAGLSIFPRLLPNEKLS